MLPARFQAVKAESGLDLLAQIASETPDSKTHHEADQRAIRDINSLFEAPSFIAEHKQFDTYEDTTLDAALHTACELFLKKGLAKDISVLKFTTHLHTSQLGLAAEYFYQLALNETSPVLQKNYFDMSYYLYFRAVESADIHSCGMLGTYFLEKGQFGIAQMLFNIHVIAAKERDNLAYIGAYVMSMNKDTRHFNKAVENLDKVLLNTHPNLLRLHPRISRWLVIMGDSFKQDLSTDYPTTAAKATMCYKLALKFDHNNHVARLNTLPIPGFSGIVPTSETKAEPAALPLAASSKRKAEIRVVFTSEAVRQKFFALGGKMPESAETQDINEEQAAHRKKRMRPGSSRQVS